MHELYENIALKLQSFEFYNKTISIPFNDSLIARRDKANLNGLENVRQLFYIRAQSPRELHHRNSEISAIRVQLECAATGTPFLVSRNSRTKVRSYLN